MDNNMNQATADSSTQAPEFQYSGFWIRFIAYFIDAIILTIPTLLAGISRQFILGLGVNLFIGLFYYPIFESSELMGTPGKALMGLVVTSEKGERITFKAAMVRYFMKYVSALICYVGYFMQIFTARRQTLHDMVSETVVISRQTPDLNYFTVWKNQFKNVVDKL